jgi:transketolase
VGFIKEEKNRIEILAEEIRESILEMLVHAGSGHTAGPLGMADVFAVLYSDVLRHDPKNPMWENRDRVILSNGHICPVLYATMAHVGYFNISELLTLRKFGSRLQGHPHREFLPGIETSSGPLGTGLSQAIGMALADKYLNEKTLKYFYVFMGDGEMNEGNVWESLLLLGKKKITNIITIIDRNKIQIDGYTEDVMPLEPLADKLKSFNLNVVEINGNDVREILSGFDLAKKPREKPTVIIAHTIPGKGWNAIEGDYRWHGKPPNRKEADSALDQMRTLYNRLENN